MVSEVEEVKESRYQCIRSHRMIERFEVRQDLKGVLKASVMEVS